MAGLGAQSNPTQVGLFSLVDQPSLLIDQPSLLTHHCFFSLLCDPSIKWFCKAALILVSEVTAASTKHVSRESQGLIMVPCSRNTRGLQTSYVLADPPCIQRKSLICASQKL